MDFPNPEQFAAGTGFAVLFLAAGHWFPWPIFLDGHLPTIPRYVYGTIAIWLAFAIWQWPDYAAVLGLLAICIVSGAFVTAFHAIDAYGTARRKAKIADKEFGNG